MTRPSPDPVVEAVVGKLRSRSAAGEEALDFANYLELLIQRVERLPGVDHG